MSPVPLQSYIIGGHVYDQNQQLISGATVSLINSTTGEVLGTADQATTNANGEYIVNMENLSTYSDGDSYEVFVTKSGYDISIMSKVIGVVDLDKPGESGKDLYLEKKDFKIIGSVRDYFNISSKKQSFMVWANNKQGATSAVITSGGGGRGRGYTSSGKPVINLKSDQVCYVTQLTAMVRTAAKTCSFEVVKCSSADGAGTVTAVSGQVYEANGTLVEAKPFTIKFANPIRVEYDADGALSVGVRMAATDTSTYVDFILEGYLLEG